MTWFLGFGSRQYAGAVHHSLSLYNSSTAHPLVVERVFPSALHHSWALKMNHSLGYEGWPKKVAICGSSHEQVLCGPSLAVPQHLIVNTHWSLHLSFRPVFLPTLRQTASRVI
jgi:hypothetical protein